MFFIYGIYAAATEGISKASTTNIVDKKDAATAVGTYSAFKVFSRGSKYICRFYLV